MYVDLPTPLAPSTGMYSESGFLPDMSLAAARRGATQACERQSVGDRCQRSPVEPVVVTKDEGRERRVRRDPRQSSRAFGAPRKLFLRTPCDQERFSPRPDRGRPSRGDRVAVARMSTYKFAMLGDGGAGKTALTTQYIQNHFLGPDYYDPYYIGAYAYPKRRVGFGNS